MALTVGTVTPTVIGSKRLNYCTVTAATTGVNALTPNQVGMESVDGVWIIGGASGAELWVDYDGTDLTLGDESGAVASGTVKLAFLGR